MTDDTKREPVAWIVEDENWRTLSFDPAFREGTVRTIPLYAAPPSAEDAERWRYAASHYEWHRIVVDGEERTYIMVRVANGADLSCAAMANHAIDAARKREGA